MNIFLGILCAILFLVVCYGIAFLFAAIGFSIAADDWERRLEERERY